MHSPIQISTLRKKRDSVLTFGSKVSLTTLFASIAFTSLASSTLAQEQSSSESISSEASKVFSNDFMLHLKPQIKSDDLEKLQDPFVKQWTDKVLKKEINPKNRALVAEPYETLSSLAKRLKTSEYSKFENPTGIYYTTEQPAVIVLGDPKEHKIELVIHEFGEAGGHSSYPLKKGVNVIQPKNSGLAYISYFSDDYKKAPKVPVSVLNGEENGVFRAGVSKNADWDAMLDKAPSQMIDIVGKRVHLVYPVEQLKKFASGKGEELIAVYDKIIANQQEVMGLPKYKRVPKNHMFGRGIWRGFMHADGMGAAFHVNTMGEVGNPDRIPNSSWGIAHEFGHVNQVRPGMKWVSTTEVTNNIYSSTINYVLNPTSMRLEHERINAGDGNVIGGRFNSYLNNGVINGESWLCQKGPDKMQGYEQGGDHFVKLCPLWQLQLYFKFAGLGNKDIYPDIFEIVRKTDDSKLSNGQMQLNFMKNACDVTRQNLTGFFEKAGMLKPIDLELDDYSRGQLTITKEDCEQLKAYAKKYPHPVSPVIYYISSNSVPIFKSKAPVHGTLNQGVTGEGNERTISHEQWKNAIAYEVYSDGKLIKAAICGTNSPDNSSTTVPFPEGADTIKAVSWDGKRTDVYKK